MAVTVSVPVGSTWTPVAGAGEVIVTAASNIADLYFAISDGTVPSVEMTGHLVRRKGNSAANLLSGEVMYLRSSTPEIQNVAVTAETPASEL